MQRIIDLLNKSGVSQDLALAITESLEDYKTSVRSQFETDYAAKVEQAKKVCLEETESHKRELVRRLQIFLETKNTAIESGIARQSAIGESVAVSKLKDMKALLEGIELNASAQNGNTAQIEKAKAKIRQLTEERDNAITTANRQTAIAEKVLARNRQLVAESKISKTTVTHGRPVVENKNKQSARIDGGRSKTTTQTTRPTIVENQTRRPAEQQQRQPAQPAGGISRIAAEMDDI